MCLHFSSGKQPLQRPQFPQAQELAQDLELALGLVPALAPAQAPAQALDRQALAVRPQKALKAYI